ncbi:hypothetical protein ACRAWD_03150 [Caulobacter segnis]
MRTTLNGIEAYSATTGSTLGVVGITRSRGFDFSTFASELFNSVTVSKSQSAEMDEGSLAATVDLHWPSVRQEGLPRRRLGPGRLLRQQQVQGPALRRPDQRHLGYFRRPVLAGL